MKWNELPPEIQEKMLSYQEAQGNKRNPEIFMESLSTNSVGKGFTWERTVEGWTFWNTVLTEGNVKIFYQKYPKKDEFPEKWCIIASEECKDWAIEWDKAHPKNKTNIGFSNINWYYCPVSSSDVTKWSYQEDKPEGYTVIDFNTFKTKVLKQSSMKKNTITRRQLIEAYEAFDCSSWKEEIASILKSPRAYLATDDTPITITDSSIQKLNKDGTSSMKDYVAGLGITLEEDKNAFIKKFSAVDLDDVNNRLFGEQDVLRIGYGAVPKNRTDLEGKSLWIDDNFNVILHKSPVGGIIVEITKK